MNNLKDIKWYSTVKTKMTLFLILTMTVVTIVAGLFSYNYFKDYETNRLTDFANTSAERLAKSLETPMWNIDRELVEELLNTEMAEQTMVGIVITDEGDKGVFSSKGREQSGQVIDYTGPFSADNIRVSRNIVREEANIGSVDVYITREFLNEILNKIAIGAAVLVIILAIAIFLLMNILLNRIVINPLLELADTADAISLGKLNQAFDISSKDEIGYLAESFKKMQVSLRIAMNRLSEPKQDAPANKSSFSPQILQGFSQEIRSAGRLPSLSSIFKVAASANTVPDDLVSVAWKEWNQQQ